MTVRAWFPFYPADWLLDDDVMNMSLAAQGAYASLLMYQWHDGTCSLPNDPERLRKMLRCTNKEFTKIWPAVSKKFPVLTGDGSRLANLRLLSVRSRAEERSDKARDSANKRWESHDTSDANALPSQSDRNAQRADQKRIEKKEDIRPEESVTPPTRARNGTAPPPPKPAPPDRPAAQRLDYQRVVDEWKKRFDVVIRDHQLLTGGTDSFVSWAELLASQQQPPVEVTAYAERMVAAYAVYVEGCTVGRKPAASPRGLVEKITEVQKIIAGQRDVVPREAIPDRARGGAPRDEIRTQPPDGAEVLRGIQRRE